MHFNRKGQPCNCGFGRNQPPIDEQWHIAGEVIPFPGGSQRINDGEGYFHATDAENRPYIEQHGLQRARPYVNPDYWEMGKPNPGESVQRWLVEQPEGVYLGKNPGVTFTTAPQYDEWHVDPAYVKETVPDKNYIGTDIALHDIPPEALTLIKRYNPRTKSTETVLPKQEEENRAWLLHDQPSQ